MTNDDMVDDAVTQVVARMHGIEAGPTDHTTMRPVPISEVEVEGRPHKPCLILALQ